MASISQFSRPVADRAARGPQRLPNQIGCWEPVRLIGEGQLSLIYQVRPVDSAPDQPACHALKVLRAEWQDDTRGLAILAREVHVGRKVTHPHLVPILAANLAEPPYYVAMPWLEGQSLAEYLRAGEAVDLPIVFWIARQVAEALEALHLAGWIHGDVKPSNIMVSPSGHATLIDLGFARHHSERNAVADRPLMGTLHYTAPEMLYSAAGGGVQCDVYSLGVVLFEMLTGRVPFSAVDVSDLAAQHRQELPGDLRSIVPYVPTRAARLVQQMLAKQPLRRPPLRDVVDRLVGLEIETFSERFPQLSA